MKTNKKLTKKQQKIWTTRIAWLSYAICVLIMALYSWCAFETYNYAQYALAGKPMLFDGLIVLSFGIFFAFGSPVFAIINYFASKYVQFCDQAEKSDAVKTKYLELAIFNIAIILIPLIALRASVLGLSILSIIVFVLFGIAILFPLFRKLGGALLDKRGIKAISTVFRVFAILYITVVAIGILAIIFNS